MPSSTSYEVGEFRTQQFKILEDPGTSADARELAKIRLQISVQQEVGAWQAIATEEQAKAVEIQTKAIKAQDDIAQQQVRAMKTLNWLTGALIFTSFVAAFGTLWLIFHPVATAVCGK